MPLGPKFLVKQRLAEDRIYRNVQVNSNSFMSNAVVCAEIRYLNDRTYIEPTAFGAQVVNFTTKALASHSGFPKIAILQYTHSSAIIQIAGGHPAGRVHTQATATLNIIKHYQNFI
uniref:Uncharacterized protein n=1 Tax=Glossina austeni TaxID=7395 RepID=A0A1A9VE52_GLOAU